MRPRSAWLSVKSVRKIIVIVTSTAYLQTSTAGTPTSTAYIQTSTACTQTSTACTQTDTPGRDCVQTREPRDSRPRQVLVSVQ